MVAYPAVVILFLTVLGTTYARHTVDSPTNPVESIQTQPHVESAEISNENTNPGDTNKYRLDFYYDGVEELGPFASYQFEGSLRQQQQQQANLTSTTSTPESISISNITTGASVPTTASPVSSTRKPSSSTTVKSAGAGASEASNTGEEDETELVVSTTPFKVDSLGSVVKINNTEDDDSSEEQCDEGEVKRVKCNTCVCTDGVFFCSKKTCPEKNEEEPSDDLLNADILNDDAAVHLIMEKVVPVFGSSNNNKHIKNKWSWKKKQPTTPLPDCTNGMTKTVDCNNCLCTKGRWHCTKSSCIALTLREKASYTDGSLVKKVEGLKENHHLDEDCLEGSTREANCNQCVCHYNSWSCTNLPCSTTKAPTHIKEIEEACQVEGDVKSKECNICRCKRGVWVCTTNNCMVFGVAKIPYYPPKFRNDHLKKP